MSSTNRGVLRHGADNYPTPPWAVHRLLDANPEFFSSFRRPSDSNFLEPCAGDGAIIRAVLDYGLDGWWDMVELRKAKKVQKGLNDLSFHGEAYFGQDFFSFAHEYGIQKGTYDLAMTNPPFSLAWEFLHECWVLCDHICFLLRLNFFGSEVRQEWMQRNMPDVYILPNRPKFRKNKHGKMGTDSIEYAWFHWDTRIPERREGKSYLLDLTPLEDRR